MTISLTIRLMNSDCYAYVFDISGPSGSPVPSKRCPVTLQRRRGERPVSRRLRRRKSWRKKANSCSSWRWPPPTFTWPLPTFTWPLHDLHQPSHDLLTFTWPLWRLCCLIWPVCPLCFAFCVFYKIIVAYVLVTFTFISLTFRWLIYMTSDLQVFISWCQLSHNFLYLWSHLIFILLSCLLLLNCEHRGDLLSMLIFLLNFIIT